MTTLTIPHEAPYANLYPANPIPVKFCPECRAEEKYVGFGCVESYSSFMGWPQWDYEECAGAPVSFLVRYDEDEFVYNVCSPECKRCRCVSGSEATDGGQDNGTPSLRSAGRDVLKEVA